MNPDIIPPPTPPAVAPTPGGMTTNLRGSYSSGTSTKRQKFKSTLSTILVLVIAPLIALALTAFVFQSYEVDGQSMETTLHNKDRLIVAKAPRTLARLSGHDYIPNRGDVIVFVKRDSTESFNGQNRQLIKRVLGLPGERVVVKDSKVIVYNTEHPDGFQPDKTLAYGSVIPDTSGSIDLVVPAGSVFVCGDNRSNSLDSRVFGPVASSDIVGKLILRIFPLNSAKTF